MNQSIARHSSSFDAVIDDDELDHSYNDDNDDDNEPDPENLSVPTLTTTSTANHASSSTAAPSGSAFDADTAVVTTDRLKSTYLADGHTMVNQYVLEAKVGSGQHGNVWRCHDHLNKHKILAMKIVKRDNPKAKRERQYKQLRQQNIPKTEHVTVVDGVRTAEQEIRREIAIMKKCLHPHVVRLYEVIDDRQKDQIYMVMEYLGGGEIKYTNGDNEPILTVEQTRRIMRDAILGLEYLHHQGIIHRDIKPANLIWTANHDRVKIADFGTAHFSYAQRLASVRADEWVKPQEDEDPILLNDAALAKRAGSPAFLAPEIVWEYTDDKEEGEERPPVTKAIDIWALGVTLYCFLFGKIPFRPPGIYDDFTEWTGYVYTCNHDWRAAQYMGYDRIPTGGRHPTVEEDENGALLEGPVVMHLLDHLLQKNYLVRITLDEVKENRWFLHDLPNPDTWLELTNPKPIDVSQEETSDAMSILKFRWNPFRRMGTFLRNTVAGRGNDQHRRSLLPPTLPSSSQASSSKLNLSLGLGMGSSRADAVQKRTSRAQSGRKDSGRRAKSVGRGRDDDDGAGTVSEPNMRLRNYRHTHGDASSSRPHHRSSGTKEKGKQRDDGLETARNTGRAGPGSSASTSARQKNRWSSASRHTSKGLESDQRSKSSDDGLRKAAQRRSGRQQQQQVHGQSPSPGVPGQTVHQVHTASSLPTATQTLRAVASGSGTSTKRRGSDARSTSYLPSSSVSTSPTASSPYPSNPSSPHPSSTNSGYGDLQSPSSSSLLPISPSTPHSNNNSPTGTGSGVHSKSHSKTPSFSSFPTLNLSTPSIHLPRLGKGWSKKDKSRPGTPTNASSPQSPASPSASMTMTPTPVRPIAGATAATATVITTTSPSPSPISCSPGGSSSRKSGSGLGSLLTGIPYWKQLRSLSQQGPILTGKNKGGTSMTAPATTVSSPMGEYVQSPIGGSMDNGSAVQLVGGSRKSSGVASSSRSPSGSAYASSAQVSRDDFHDDGSSMDASISFSTPDVSSMNLDMGTSTMTARSFGARSGASGSGVGSSIGERYLSPTARVPGSSNSLEVPTISPNGYQSMTLDYANRRGGGGAQANPGLMYDVDLVLGRRTSSWDHDHPRELEYEDFPSLHSEDDLLAGRDVDDHVVYIGAGGVANRQQLEEEEKRREQVWLENRRRVVEAERRAREETERKEKEGQQEPRKKKKSILVQDEDDEDDYEDDGVVTAGPSRTAPPRVSSSSYVDDDDSEVLTFSARKKKSN
ncbi:hypothetical protein VKT23_004968 [Stygiomarasmius scandens]|uniref:Protein kinase domain-containing protein n=1 Tax=Marasmiellus scandens TaxID=2682957 RepID=A0ABR1JRQ7_9AGAR